MTQATSPLLYATFVPLSSDSLNIPQLVQDVEEVFLQLDEEISAFKQWSGLQCKVGCGKCCLKPDIEATILEFIPFAYHLYKQGIAIEWLERVSHRDSICAILDTSQSGIGHCSSYKHRGLICRLFGFSSRITKYGPRDLVSCAVIKAEQPEAFLVASASTIAGGQVPLMRDYYMRMCSIDWELSQNFYPINIAIKKAIEEVLHYYAYREDLTVTI